MNEKIALAIVQLLAYSARLDGLVESETLLVEEFFKELLPEQEVPRFMALFKRYASQEGSVESIQQLCQRLNSTLTYPQKVVALLRMMQVTTADHDLTKEERAFLTEVSAALNISADCLDLLLLFETGTLVEGKVWPFKHQDLLLLHGGDTDLDNNIYHHHDLPGVLLFMAVPGTELFFMRPLRLDHDMTLQGNRLAPNRIYALAPGGTIRAAGMGPVFQSDIIARFRPIPSSQRVSITAQNVSLQFVTGGWGLRDVSLTADGGHLVAIMGASGSGKSTLLSVLNGNMACTQGKVLINGKYDAFHDHDAVRSLIGYVPQDDLLIEELTVYENLIVAAKLSFKDKKEAELEDLVQNTLQRLGLSDIQHLRVGNALNKTISGGQRKRVNIGLELLRTPQLLFVDEPTSGLSSHDSENIIDLLRELALQGNLVFVVIHQPSSTIYKMFNRLLVMDTGGYPIYYGNPLEALIYFRTQEDLLNRTEAECAQCGNVNAEEIFQIVERRQVDEYGWETQERKVKPAEWGKKWQAHLEKVSAPNTPDLDEYPALPEAKVPSWLKQCQVFAWRNAKAKLRNSQYLWINLLQAPVLALLMGGILRFDRINDLQQTEEYIFRENMNVPVYLFVMVIISLFMGLLISAEEIIKDRKIKKREAFLNLSWSSYLGAKLIWLFTLSALQTATFVIIGNHLMGLDSMNLYCWLLCFSTACFANVLGLNISDSFNSAITIYIVIPLALIPQLVFGGVMVRFDQMNPHVSNWERVPILGDLMTSRWAFEGLMVHQFTENLYHKPLYAIEKKVSNAHYKAILLIDNTLLKKLDNLTEDLNYAGALAQEERHEDLLIISGYLEHEPKLGTFERQLGLTALQEPLSLEKLDKVRGTLLKLKKAYLKSYNGALQERDKVMQTLGATKKVELENLYANDYLNMIALDRNNLDHVVQVGHNLYRRYEPIYYDPEYHKHALDFGAHFFAPRKHLAGMYWPTPFFNIGVIWAMTLALLVGLYFRLGKALSGLGRQLNRKSRTKA